MLGTWYFVAEQRSSVNFSELRTALGGLRSALRTKGLWVVGFFLFLYYFSPGFNTPLYYHMTDTLHFPQGYIGLLGSIASAGSVVGALLYRWYLTEMTSKRLLQLSIVLGTLSTASFLLLFLRHAWLIVSSPTFAYPYRSMARR